MTMPDFQNERDFRDNWIAPFLAKLGFMIVKNTHGASEQGKDFFFAEYDRFGHIRVFAAQVKIGNISEGKGQISDLLDQVKRCFGVRLRFHKSAHEQRIASVYVMTNGTISEQARIRIHDWCAGERFGENVFFLDGEQLENKDRFATYDTDQERRQLLTALQFEVLQNNLQLQHQMQQLTGGRVMFSVFRLISIENALQRFQLEIGSDIYQHLEKLWRILTHFKEFRTPMNIAWTDEAKSNFLVLTNDCLNYSQWVYTYCVEQLRILNERYSLEVTDIIDEPGS